MTKGSERLEEWKIVESYLPKLSTPLKKKYYKYHKDLYLNFFGKPKYLTDGISESEMFPDSLRLFFHLWYDPEPCEDKYNTLVMCEQDELQVTSARVYLLRFSREDLDVDYGAVGSSLRARLMAECLNPKTDYKDWIYFTSPRGKTFGCLPPANVLSAVHSGLDITTKVNLKSPPPGIFLYKHLIYNLENYYSICVSSGRDERLKRIVKILRLYCEQGIELKEVDYIYQELVHYFSETASEQVKRFWIDS